MYERIFVDWIEANIDAEKDAIWCVHFEPGRKDAHGCKDVHGCVEAIILHIDTKMRVFKKTVTHFENAKFILSFSKSAKKIFLTVKLFMIKSFITILILIII